MTADIFADAEAFRAACAGGTLIVPMTADGGNLERASAMIDALRIGRRVLLMECNGVALDHAEGEGCEACDAERLRREALRLARERGPARIRFDTAALLETGRLVVADMALEADIRRELSARWIRRPVELVLCERRNCVFEAARCIGCPED